MERELPSEKGASCWGGCFLVGKSFSVGKELPGEKRAFRWEESFPVGRELPGKKSWGANILKKSIKNKNTKKTQKSRKIFKKTLFVFFVFFVFLGFFPSFSR